jgi:Tfp pilus assembly protein PilV
MSPIPKPLRGMPRPAEGGFSLVELMVVVVFVAVGILALVGVQTHSFTDVHSSGRHTRALDLAELRMEVARAAGFAGAIRDSGTVDTYNWLTAVDSVDVGLRRVTVTVGWTEANGPRSLRITNLLSTR